MSKAERGGFEPPRFHNLLVGQQVTRKPFYYKSLAHSGYPSLLPVVTGYSGGQQGQKRDNFVKASGVLSHPKIGRSSLFFTFLLLFSVLAAASIVHNNNDKKSRQLTPEETRAEIKKLIAGFHKQLPRNKARQIGAIYARYSSKDQNSILDQVRVCLEDAVKKLIFVPLEYIFFDQAVSGRKSRRKGFQQLEKCLSGKNAQALLIFTTNRLFRRMVKAIEFVEIQVKERNIRCIFVMSNIDSEKDDQWKRFLNFLCMHDEFAAEMYVENIRAAHQGKLLNRQVHGTLAFGYTGEPIPGSVNHKGKPNCLIVIEESEARIVRQVFNWFVIDHLAINSIIRCLNNDPNVPPPPKGATEQWTRLAVKTMLRNERYHGLWEYGKKEAVLMPTKDYIKQVERNQPLKSVQFEELRIISDQLFYLAQKRLQNMIDNRGRPSKDGVRKTRPKVLNGLFWCPGHQRILYVSGAYGQYMTCPSCLRELPESRTLFTQLN